MSGYNPYLYMQSPNGGFSGSGFELNDPYSQYQGVALPPTAYPAQAYNALGQQIWSAPPPAPQPPAAAPAPAAAPSQNDQLRNALAFGLFGSPQFLTGNYTSTPMTAGGNAPLNPGTQMAMQMMGLLPSQTAAQPSAPQAPPRQTNAGYLQALANPGRVTTPGVAIPGGAQYQPGAGVFPALSQQWASRGIPGTLGPSSGRLNQPFIQALNQLQQRGAF